MTRPRRTAVLVAIALAALAVLLIAVAVRGVRARRSGEPLGPAAMIVRSAPVGHGAVERRLSLSGTLAAADAATVAPRMSAPVVARLVDPGDRVRRGQPLLLLEDARLEAAVRAAEAELAAGHARLADAEHQAEVQRAVAARDETLFAAGGVSQEALERSRAQQGSAAAGAVAARRGTEALAAATATAREQLADARLLAPWDGAVAEVLLEAGDLAAAGQPAVRLVRDGGVRVRVRLPQDAARTVSAGTPVELSSGSLRQSATVARVGAGLDPTGLALAEIDLERPPFGLTDGASIGVAVVIEQASGVTVPAGALLRGSTGDVVFRVEDATVRPVPVTVELEGADEAVVRGDLEPGQQVVVEHPSVLMRLAAGTPVQVAEAP